MRLEALKKEEAELTFKPKINKYHDVQAQLNLRHPEAYLAQVHAKKQAQLAHRLEERRLMEVHACKWHSIWYGSTHCRCVFW